jgi:hypothetical protein
LSAVHAVPETTLCGPPTQVQQTVSFTWMLMDAGLNDIP